MKLLTMLLAAAGAAALTGCERQSAIAAAAPALPAMKVTTVVVRAEPTPVDIDVTGTVRPVQHAQLAAKVMGAIEEMPVTLGQAVKRGDLLVKISAGEINARAAQAQSQLNQARRDLEREHDLLTKGASTADMVRGLEDRFTGAQAMMREAEVMLGYATLRAPFDGVVARKLAQVGDLAAPGMPLIEIEGTNGFEIDAGVPDSLVGTLSVGTTIAVEIPVAGTTVSGRVAEVSSAADANAHTVAVKISLPANDAIRSGQFARLHVPGTPVSALLAPVAAVSRDGQIERVFVAGHDRRAELRLVKTGARHGDRVELLSGVDDGERVVVAGAAGLREGQTLEFQP
jgi:RND family efflux transporter MFP subunit